VVAGGVVASAGGASAGGIVPMASAGAVVVAFGSVGMVVAGGLALIASAGGAALLMLSAGAVAAVSAAVPSSAAFCWQAVSETAIAAAAAADVRTFSFIGSPLRIPPTKANCSAGPAVPEVVITLFRNAARLPALGSAVDEAGGGGFHPVAIKGETYDEEGS
jgi:hypothetical protein